MHLKIHTTLPGSKFDLHPSFNIFPFPTVLNKLFRNAVNIQLEASPVVTLAQARDLRFFVGGWLPDWFAKN